MRDHSARDHTLLIVDDIPHVGPGSPLYLKTHCGLPEPAALRNLYALIGQASQAFVFSHYYHSVNGTNSTGEAIFNRHIATMLQRAFGSRPPSFFIELGWRPMYPLQGHRQTTGLYGHQHRYEHELGRTTGPTLINLFSEFHWNKFYDQFRGTRESGKSEHQITERDVYEGALRVLQDELGIVEFRQTLQHDPMTFEALLDYGVLKSPYFRRVAYVTWEGVYPIVERSANTDYSGPMPCQCGDFDCEDYPDCVVL